MNKFNYALLTIAALLTASCNDFDNDWDAKRIQYQENFEEMFGKIDPNQDWNLAERGTVTVTTNRPSNIKIFGMSGAGYQLMASYSNVEGQKELAFDIPQGSEEILVSDGMTSKRVNVGGSVSFGSVTRTIHTGSFYAGAIEVKELSGWRYFKNDEITAYTTVAPEEEENTSKVTCNYTLVSNGKFVIYPVYFNTGSWSTVGVYFRDAEGDIHTVDVYTIKHGEDFQYYNGSIWKSFDGSEFIQDATQSASEDPSGFLLRSKGIEVDIPEGTVFGMYLRVESNQGTELASGEKWINYSETELNSDNYRSTTTGGSKEYINRDCINESLAAFYTVGDYTYFSFEDWSTQRTDLNDIVFMFGGNVPTSTDHEAQQWLISCEDLSETTGDNDFNDVVFMVSHGENYTTANITPLATGAIYKADIYYGAKKLGEIHDLIVPRTTDNYENGKLPFYNTESTMDQYGAGQQLTIPVSAEFTLAPYVPGGANAWTSSASGTNMGDFKIHSYRQEGGESDAYIVSADRGTAPTMLCVPGTYQVSEGVKSLCVWPKERHGISSAYPNFSSWVADGTTNSDWYKTVNKDEVVTGRFLTIVEEGASSDLNKMRPMKLSHSDITLEVGEDRFVQITRGGSDGSITVSSGNTDYAEALLSGDVITIHGVTEGIATVTVMMTASSNGKYSQQQKVINVTVEAQRQASEFAISPASPIAMTTIDDPKTITITSLSSETPTISNVTGTSVSVGTVTGSNGTWTITLTPNTQGETSFYVNQASNEIYKASSQKVTVTVDAPDLGTPISNVTDYGTGHEGMPAYIFAAGSMPEGKTMTITLVTNSGNYVQLYCANLDWSHNQTFGSQGEGKAASREWRTDDIRGAAFYVNFQQGNNGQANVYVKFE